VGKSPLKVSKAPQRKSDLQELRTRLSRAIETEAFEEAARIRDQIKELERKSAEEKESNETK